MIEKWKSGIESAKAKKEQIVRNGNRLFNKNLYPNLGVDVEVSSIVTVYQPYP